MIDNTAHKRSSPLGPLLKKQLTGLCFVQDYVQLQFDDCGLTALAWPVINFGDTKLEYGMSGYRDALCGLIAKIVCSATVTEGQQVEITFDDHSSITVSLRPEDCDGPEAVIFNCGSDVIWVW